MINICTPVDSSDDGLNDGLDQVGERISSDLEDHLKIVNGSEKPDSISTLQQPPNDDHVQTFHNGSNYIDNAKNSVLEEPRNVDIIHDHYDNSDEEIIARLKYLEDKQLWRNYSKECDDEAENFMMKSARDARGTLWDYLRSLHFQYKLQGKLLHILDNYGMNRYH